MTALFVDQVKKNREDGREGYDRAVHWALKNGILEEYLSMRTRILNGMLVAEYDMRTSYASSKGRSTGRRYRDRNGKRNGRENKKYGLPYETQGLFNS